MAPITTASDESNHMALLDKLDMHKIHKPFRNPNWKPPQRRNKTLKQIISEAQRREQQAQQQSVAATQNNSAAATPQPNDSANPDPQPLQPYTAPSYTYTSIQAAPSFKPKQKYCDITGLPSTYNDPKTGLRYYNTEVYGLVKTLSTTQVQDYLAARGAHTVLK